MNTANIRQRLSKGLEGSHLSIQNAPKSHAFSHDKDTLHAKTLIHLKPTFQSKSCKFFETAQCTFIPRH